MKKLLLLTLFIGISSSACRFTALQDFSADGHFTFSSTAVPLPLGRYVQLSSTSIPFKFSQPNGNGDGEWSANFNFEVLRHVPKLEYCDIRIAPIDGKELDEFYFKFKKDQDAVEKLSQSIANEHSTRAIVKYTSQYKDLTTQEIDRIKRQWNGTEMVMSTSIGILIPSSQISLIGPNPHGIKIKEADIHLYCNEGVSFIRMELNIHISHLGNTQLSYNRITANLKTQNGNYTTLFENKNMGYGINDLIQFDNEIGISPREMDQLLTYPISIELEFE